MELNFDDAVIATGSVKNYLEVGNHLVKTTEVIKGESSQKKSPYVQITVADQSGKTCSQQYYINGGAWNISKSAILTLVAAAQNCDETTAKSKLAGLTGDNVDVKLASLLVGKTIGLTLNGEWVNPTDSSKASWVKSVFGSYLFAVPAADFEKLSKKSYIKGEDMSASKASAAPSGAIKADVSAWD